MRFLLTALLLLPALVSAQELHTFKNGEVADADKINETHQYILNNASGGCSATQQDNSVLIECADGTSGVIAGAGTVVAYPEGGIIGQAPTQSWSTGDIVFQDALNVTLAEASSIGGTTTVVLDGYRGTFYNDALHQSVQLTAWGGGSDIFYLTGDCSGQVFVQALSGIDPGVFYEKEGVVYIKDTSFDGADILFKSKQRSGNANFGTNTYSAVGACMPGQFVVDARPAVTYTPAPEILNAAYPVRLEQLP